MFYWMKRILFGARIELCPASQRDALAVRIKALEQRELEVEELANKVIEELEKRNTGLKAEVTELKQRPLASTPTPPPPCPVGPRVSPGGHNDIVTDLRRALRSMDNNIRDMYPISSLEDTLKQMVVAACYAALYNEFKNMYDKKDYPKGWKMLLKVLKVRADMGIGKEDK